MRKLFIILALLSFLLLNFNNYALAHRGRTDAYGGHNNKASGTYHFHSGPLAGQVFSSKAEALDVLSKFKAQEKSTKKEAPKEIVFVGSVKSNKYHYPNCVWAKKISPNNLITFSSLKDAQAKGYIPCKVCKPPLE